MLCGLPLARFAGFGLLFILVHSFVKTMSPAHIFRLATIVTSIWSQPRRVVPPTDELTFSHLVNNDSAMCCHGELLYTLDLLAHPAAKTYIDSYMRSERQKPDSPIKTKEYFEFNNKSTPFETFEYEYAHDSTHCDIMTPENAYAAATYITRTNDRYNHQDSVEQYIPNAADTRNPISPSHSMTGTHGRDNVPPFFNTGAAVTRCAVDRYQATTVGPFLQVSESNTSGTCEPTQFTTPTLSTTLLSLLRWPSWHSPL